jgi:hypothetical protein
MTTQEILDPAGQIQAVAALKCNPIGTLEGRRVAILDNTKPNFQRLAMLVAEKLRDDYSVASITHYRKENATVGASAELLDEIARSADLVLTGSGD